MLEAMQNFIQVVESGSFSNASKTLNKNASSVARQIDKLEDELGTQLFTRSTRRLDLTLAGQSFYEQSVEILTAVNNAKQSVKQGCSEVRGSIAISVLDSFGRRRIAPILPEFCKLYPNVHVAISLDNSMVDLYQSHFDLAIRYGKPSDSNLIMKPLLKDETFLVASQTYIDSHAPIQHPEDLKAHDCLTFHRQRQHTFWHFEKDQEKRRIKVKGPLSSCGGEPLVAWAKSGLGLTLMSRWIIDTELKQGSLVRVLSDWTTMLNENQSSSIYMTWTTVAAQRPAVRCFIDFLADYFTQHQDA